MLLYNFSLGIITFQSLKWLFWRRGVLAHYKFVFSTSEMCHCLSLGFRSSLVVFRFAQEHFCNKAMRILPSFLSLVFSSYLLILMWWIWRPFLRIASKVYDVLQIFICFSITDWKKLVSELWNLYLQHPWVNIDETLSGGFHHFRD